MDYRFETRKSKIVLIIQDDSGVEHVYPVATTKARNLSAQLTAVLKSVK